MWKMTTAAVAAAVAVAGGPSRLPVAGAAASPPPPWQTWTPPAVGTAGASSSTAPSRRASATSPPTRSSAASESWRPGVPPPSAAAAFSADAGMGGGAPGLPAPLVLSLLTHHPSIPHTHPIIPGVYAGAGRAVAAAAAAVRAGDAEPAELRLFLGAVRWRQGRLREAVEAGEVFVAAAAGGVVTKQCLGLPTPLWREVMEAMGEPFRRLSRQAYGEL